jgi:glycine cleavage system H protein
MSEVRYTTEHEWVRVNDSGTVTFGITDFAQEALGDIVYLDLPAVGSALTAGQTCGEVESTKSVSDIYAPINGQVLAVNGEAVSAPETVNQDPLGNGWLVEMQPSDPNEFGDLLTAADYEAFTRQA